MDNKKLDTFFKHREKQVFLEFKEQEKQLDDRIHLHNILELIQDENVINLLKEYVKQNNSIISTLNKTFYIQGVQDSKYLLRLNEKIALDEPDF